MGIKTSEGIILIDSMWDNRDAQFIKDKYKANIVMRETDEYKLYFIFKNS